jgi:HAE1 family hydrophobic/amphiphilic exporter-1
MDQSASRPSFFAFTTTRPVAITMMVAAAVVFGVVGLWRLPVNLLPDISYPTVTIRTQYPGATPQDVEERVSERIQESVSVIPGVRRVTSVSRPEVSDVVLEFAWGTQMVFAVSDIRERLDRVVLPQEADDPLVLRYDPSLDPVLTLGLSGDKSAVELRRIAEEEIERELGEVEGVAAVKLRGGDEEEVRIAVDEPALTAHRIDVSAIGQRLAAENLNAAAGSVDEGNTEYLVRAQNEFEDLDEIENLIVERRGEHSIRLRDVARVERAPPAQEVISRARGHQCVHKHV